MKELAQALATDDAAALVRAVEEAERALAGGALVEGEALAVARALAAHVRHPRSNVRTAVAWAARYMPEGVFEEVIGVLREDVSSYVKNAASRSYDERSRRRRVARVHDESSADVRALRAHIAGAYDERAARLAERLCDRALGQFVEGLHHEMVKVGTSLRLDLDDLRREARSVAGDRLGAPADQVLAKLDALLAIVQSSRTQVRRADPSFKEEKLRALIDGHIDLLRARLDEPRRTRLRVDVAIDDALTVEIDRALFGQAIANLLQNAVEAYPRDRDEGGAIEVRVAAEERLSGTFVVVVEDRGRGMPEKDLARIGEPFVSSKGSGRGLGMLNVRRVVEGMHGGSVDVGSRVGEGTVVTLEVPRRQ